MVSDAVRSALPCNSAVFAAAEAAREIKGSVQLPCVSIVSPPGAGKSTLLAGLQAQGAPCSPWVGIGVVGGGKTVA